MKHTRFSFTTTTFEPALRVGCLKEVSAFELFFLVVVVVFSFFHIFLGIIALCTGFFYISFFFLIIIFFVFYLSILIYIYFLFQLFPILQRSPLTRAFEGTFSVCLNLSFRGRQSTVSMVFHAL